MAELGRSGLNGVVQTNVPDNNTKFITPARHRKVLEDYSDSKFNKIDDDAFDVTFNNSTTDLTSEDIGAAIIELNSRIRPVLAMGTVRIGNISNSDTVGRALNTEGQFTRAEVDAFDVSSLLIKVDMSDVGTSDYQVKIDIVSVGDWNQDNTINAPTVRERTNTSFKIGIREAAALVQDIDLDIMIFKKP